MKKILPIIAVVVLIALVIDSFLPQPYSPAFDASTIAEGTEFRSPFVKIRNKEYCVFSCVIKDAYADGNDVFTISTMERYGILHNKEKFKTGSEIPLEELLDPQYETMSAVNDCEIKRGNHYYGFSYAGIAPLDCKEITIDGHKAGLEKMSLTINGKQAEFNLYYCIIESDVYIDHAEMICTDTNGEQHRITDTND